MVKTITPAAAKAKSSNIVIANPHHLNYTGSITGFSAELKPLTI
jgi:hypothetical protein